MVLLGDEALVEAHFGLLGDCGNLDASSGGSWMRIKGGLNKEDLELMLKINGDFTLSNSD
jgi:hypothetical protein